MTLQPGDKVRVLHERKYWINSATGQLVENWRFEDPKKAPPGFDDGFPWPGPVAILATQSGGGNGRRIPPDWYRKVEEINPPLIWRDVDKPGGLTWLSWYWANFKPNKEWYPDGGFLPEPPDPYPLVECLTSWSNVHKVVEVGSKSTRIKAYRYKDPVPDVLDPLMCAKMYSIDKDGNMAWMGSITPILVADEAWIPNEKLKLYEEPTMANLPLIRDYSKHQGQVNFDVAEVNGVLLMAARAAISWGYEDPKFQENWANAEGKMYRTSYHVIYPGEDITRQADNWYKAHPELDVIPRVIDMELEHGVPHERIAEAVAQMSEIVLSRDGHRPIIYSRYLLINDWLASWDNDFDDFKNAHYWWLAQYLTSGEEHPGPPTLPAGVNRERVLIHQTSDVLPGFPGEVQSASVDYNRWQLGDEAQMKTFISETWGGQEPLPDPGYDQGYADGRIAGHQEGYLDACDTMDGFLARMREDQT